MMIYIFDSTHVVSIAVQTKFNRNFTLLSLFLSHRVEIGKDGWLIFALSNEDICFCLIWLILFLWTSRGFARVHLQLFIHFNYLLNKIIRKI